MYQKSGHELLVVPQGFDDRVIKVDLREGYEKNTVEELAFVTPKRNFPLRKLSLFIQNQHFQRKIFATYI